MTPQSPADALWWKVAMHVDEAQQCLVGVLAQDPTDPVAPLMQEGLRSMQAILLDIFRAKGLVPPDPSSAAPFVPFAPPSAPPSAPDGGPPVPPGPPAPPPLDEIQVIAAAAAQPAIVVEEATAEPSVTDPPVIPVPTDEVVTAAAKAEVYEAATATSSEAEARR